MMQTNAVKLIDFPCKIDYRDYSGVWPDESRAGTPDAVHGSCIDSPSSLSPISATTKS
jgi:hypothetical protein